MYVLLFCFIVDKISSFFFFNKTCLHPTPTICSTLPLQAPETLLKSLVHTLTVRLWFAARLRYLRLVNPLKVPDDFLRGMDGHSDQSQCSFLLTEKLVTIAQYNES